MTVHALLSAQGTACMETALYDNDDTPEKDVSDNDAFELDNRAKVESGINPAEADAPVPGTWTGELREDGASDTPPIVIGNRYRFMYPPEFQLHPEYRAHSGQMVRVIRPLTEDEAQPPSPEDGITQMFEVEADDGWRGHVWEEELEAAE